MGISTPKPPFNLAEFLSQKGKPNTGRRNSWKRPTASEDYDSENQSDAADETLPHTETKPES